LVRGRYVDFLARRPDTATDTVLDLPAAVALARQSFGSLLDPEDESAASFLT
jgi:hypothetical protein